MIVLDLYREQFDPALRAEEMRRRFSFDRQIQAWERALKESNLLLFFHPDWWGQPPALLKGWIDRVMRPDIAYEYVGPEFEHKQQVGLLQDKGALVFCSSDRNIDDPSPLEAIWRGLFAFCGIIQYAIHIMYDVRETSLRQRTAWVNRVEAEVDAMILKMRCNAAVNDIE